MRSWSPLAAALALTALALPLSIAASNAGLALATLALLARARADGTRILGAWRRSPAAWGLAAYAAAGLVATAFGTGPAKSLHDNLKDAQKLWAALVLVGAFAIEDGEPVRPAFAAGFGIAAAVGCAQTVYYIATREPYHPLGRAHGFVHPVTYGDQLALGALGAFCALVLPVAGGRPDRDRRIALSLLALLAAALVFNQTRATVFALAAGFATLCVFQERPRHWAAWVAVALAAVVVGWEFLPTGGRTLLALPEHAEAFNPQSARYVLWSVAWRMFKEHPWTGVGPAHYGTLFTSYHAGPLDGQVGWASAHNLYLHQLAERGLIGAAALLAAFGALGYGALRAVRRRADGRALWAASGFAAFLVMNLTETAFQTEQLATLLLFLWAWGTAESGRPGQA